MACEYNNIVNNIENMLSKLSDNQKEKDDVKPLIKWLNEAKVIGNSNEILDKDLPATRQNLKEPSTYTVYPTAKPDMVKAKYKASKATKYVGYGKAGSSTELYAKQLSEQGMPVNTGKYDEKDVVFVSVNGTPNTEDYVNTLKQVIAALESGATVLTDSESYLSKSTYNKGEIQLAKNLMDRGYTRETSKDNNLVGVWVKPKKEKSAGQSKQLNPKFKGKFILAHAGIGKSYAVQYNSNLIDGDDLFTEAANEVVTKYNKSLNEDVQTIPDVSKMKSIFTAWGEYSTDTKKVQEAKKRREEVYQLYADKAQQLMKQGKTILSSSARPATIKIADYVIVQDNTELIKTNLQSDLRINKNSETDTNKIKEKINKFNQVALDNKIPLIKLSSQEFLSDILYSKDTTKSKPKDEAYVKQAKQQEISTESKLKQLLEVYSTGVAPKIGGGLVEDVTWWETRDEDKPKATMMKGTQEESLKDMLPKIDGRKLSKYKTAVNAWYNENKRGSAIRETLNELLELLNTVEQEPRLAEEFGWDTVETKPEDSIIFANDIIKAAKECAKG